MVIGGKSTPVNASYVLLSSPSQHVKTKRRNEMSPRIYTPRGHSHFSFLILYFLHNALLHHRTRHLHEAGNVCALYEVEVFISLTVAHALVVDVLHNLVETDVHFFI